MAGDAYDSYVTTLIALTGAADGATGYTDPYGNTITCTNGTHISTSVTHHGRPTIALTGAGNGRVLLSPSSALNLSLVSASTVEMWIYPTSISTVALFNSATNTGGMGGFFINVSSTGQLGLYLREYYCVPPGNPGALVANQWNHVAVSFVGFTAYLACNGAIIGSGNVANGATGLSGSDYAAMIGTVYNDATPSGYLGQFRVTKGVARYTSAYAVPAAAFDTTANFSGTVLDASGNPAVRTIYIYRRDTGALVGSAISDSSGAYTFAASYAGEHDLVCQDSTGNLPDLILTRVTPS